MVSLNKISQNDLHIARFAALAIVIHILEAGFPSPIPGIKPGLANVVTLIVLLRYSWKMAVWVTALRVLVGSLLIGSFLTPGFLLSATGACFSLIALAFGQFLNKNFGPVNLSAVGLSILASMAHMCGQFFLAWSLFVPHPDLLKLLPALLAAALIFGCVTGWIAARVLDRISELEEQGYKADNVPHG